MPICYYFFNLLQDYKGGNDALFVKHAVYQQRYGFD